MKKGIFIVFEGGEKVGKTTQIRLLTEYLTGKGYKLFVSKEPGGANPAIREKLLAMKNKLTGEEEFELLCEDRKLHIDNFIRPSLEAGKVVILDRFDSSSIAYQGYGRGVPLESLGRRIAELRNGTHPDLTILLDADPEKVLPRDIATARFDAEKIEFHQRVREGFRAQAVENPQTWRVEPGG